MSNSSLSPIPGPPPADDAPRSQVDCWLVDAQAGSRSALGRALEACRKYLLLVANRALDDELRAKVGASDLVQDTFIQAQRDFARFAGTNEQELLAWLTAILINRIRNNARKYLFTEQTNVHRELSGDELDEAIAQLRDRCVTPGAAAVARDEQRRVHHALAELNELDREVILGRTFRQESFVAIGQRLGCSDEAARKRWARAVRELQKILRRIG
ncbi:MAG: RNA polymerase sigma factor [Pirellulales bacterium]